MEDKVGKKPAPKPKAPEAKSKAPKAKAAKPKAADARRLRKGIFRLDFKRGVEPIPKEITGPIVGMFPRTQYSYEIIWLEEEGDGDAPPPKSPP